MASDETCILITGANTGLGFGICCRLIDEFLLSKSLDANLTLIFTTRSTKKGSDTLKALEEHLRRHASPTDRIQLRPENVELTNLKSVRSLARKLVDGRVVQKLDAIILNAGIVGITRINWPLAVWQIALENAAGVTWPRFKVSAVGTITGSQLQSEDSQEPPLGEIFCANVFGHYMLAHWLMPLLRSCDPKNPAKVMWISSIEATENHFDPDDLQCLKSQSAYENSKRLTDLLALTAANQPATRTNVNDFLSSGEKPNASLNTSPEICVVHPGIVATAIIPLPWVLAQAWMATAYVARWIGSPWHTNAAYTAAVSASWLALASSDEIRAKGGNGTVKWGSAVDRSGNAMVVKTDVSGWGLQGTGKAFKNEWWGKGWGRISGAKDATKEDVEQFIEEGAKVWQEMEKLRKEWESRLVGI